jgi:hypothetical protein
MITVFERIPEYFIVRYDSELQAWGANFAKIGVTKGIVLKEGGLSDMSPDPENGPVLLQVKLLAQVEKWRDRVTVTPLTEADEMLIRKHCEKMIRAGVAPNKFSKEPERMWIPAMPEIKPARMN